MDRSRPLARTQGLLTSDVGDELRVYDESTDAAFMLNRSAVAVWRQCNGSRSVSELVAVVGDELGQPVDEDAVLMALDKLAEYGLLLSGYEPRGDAAERLSRRRFFRRAGVVGAAAMAAPVVYPLAVPTVAFGYTPYYT